MNDIYKTKFNISVEDLEELIRFQLEALWDEDLKASWQKAHRRAVAEQVPPVMIWGPPGVGKSSVMRDIADDLGVGFIDVRLAQREPIDIRGLPVPGKDGVKWQVSSEWPRDPKGRGIILFDELTAADRTLQVAAYEFILDRRLGDLYRVPDGWYIAAAGNRTSDRAVATTLSSALANRFLHVNIEPDIETWMKWALKRDIHPDVTGFLRFKPDSLFSMEGNLERGWPSPRSWERVSTMMYMFDRTRRNNRSVSIAVEGLVGSGAGVEFIEFRKQQHKLDDVLEMMKNPEKIRIPKRPDQKYALCSSMVYHLWRGKNARDSAALLNGFYKISLLLSSDFAAMAMMDAMQGTSSLSSDECSRRLMKSEMFKQWQERHGKTLKNRKRRAG